MGPMGSTARLLRARELSGARTRLRHLAPETRTLCNMEVHSPRTFWTRSTPIGRERLRTDGFEGAAIADAKTWVDQGLMRPFDGSIAIALLFVLYVSESNF